ncbi:protein kinase domain-containing protein [Paenibacillus profundus]|uniref:protein kinase domain-containing protein n=1 Tax=Paenibacillus profundus TaxID=1173085 RepID=UPI0022795841
MGYGVTTSFKAGGQLHTVKTAVRQISVAPGTVLKGMWNERVYRIERLLGRGANGVVYLVTMLAMEENRERSSGSFALKMGVDAVDFQSEINALRSLEHQRRTQDGRVGRHGARPFLVDIDDADVSGQRIPFYVMRYVPGVSLKAYIYKNGADWYGLVGGKLLARLNKVHQHGWVFGDLKAENVLVNDDGTVELVDYGGLTAMGNSVKQFTELYDRGYWHAGSRSADCGYDLFSFAVLTIQILGEKELRERLKASLPQTRDVKDLQELVRNHPRLRPFESWLTRALKGAFASSEEAYRQWQELSHRLYRTSKKPHRPTPLWLKWFFGVSVFLLVISIALAAWGFDLRR